MAKIICPHVAFATTLDVLRLSKEVDGPIERFDLQATVVCYDCGMEFQPVRVTLVPTGKTDVERPQIVADGRTRQ